MVMDNCVEGVEEMDEDTLESSDSNMYDFTQPPLTPATHSGAQPPPLHHHNHHLNGAQIVGSTTVANDGGPVAGSTTGGGYSSVIGTLLPEWTSLSLILSTRASTIQAPLILCGYVCSIFYVVCGLDNL